MKRTLALISIITLFAGMGLGQVREARTVKYAAKDIVSVRAKVRFTTLVVLPANERILDFVVGDKDFWIVEGVQNFCYVKPAKQNSSTNVTLITAAGNVYSLLLNEVGENGGDPDLKVFIEPTEQTMIQALSGPPRFVLASEVESVKATARHETERAQEGKEVFRSEYPVKALQFDYKFKRDKKPFAVSEIYHDEKFTYIRSSAQEKPTLYEVKDGAPNLINFDLRDGVYIAPKIIDKGYLVIGKHRLDFERN
jgi:type IV secretion system protein VirB9